MSANTKERIKKLLNFNTTPRVFKHQTMHQNCQLELTGSRNKNLFSYKRKNKITDIFNTRKESIKAQPTLKTYASLERLKTEYYSQRVIYPNLAPATKTISQNLRYDVNKESTQKPETSTRRFFKTQSQEDIVTNYNQIKMPSPLKVLYDHRSQIHSLPGSLYKSPVKEQKIKNQNITDNQIQTQRPRYLSNPDNESNKKKRFPQSVNIYKQSFEYGSPSQGKRRYQYKDNQIYHETSFSKDRCETSRTIRRGSGSPFRNIFESQVRLS